MRYSNSLDILGIPSLPANAFKHVGDRKIKLYGGSNPVTDFTDDVLGIDDSGGIIGSISEGAAKVEDTIVDVGAQIDDFVGENIPGGWVTIGVAAGAYYYSGASLGAAEGATLTEAEAAALASSEATASNALASANTGAYAGTPFASTPAGASAFSGVQSSSMLDYNLGTGASGAPGITGTPAASTFELGTPTSYELGSSNFLITILSS